MTLENLRLEELMRRTSAELRAILEGVADAVAAEDPEGRLVYVNAAAARLLGGADELGTRLGIPADLLPGRRVIAGAPAEPLVVRHPGESRWSRVKASPVLEDGGARLAISVIEDITEIKQAEEAQRFLAESSRALARSLLLEETLPEVARLVAASLADACAIHLLEDGELRLVASTGRALDAPPGLEEVAARGTPRLWVEAGAPSRWPCRSSSATATAGTITLLGRRFSEPEIAIAEDLGLRVGAAVDNARLYRTRAAIAQTLQQSLLPPELPEIPGLETAALYRPGGRGQRGRRRLLRPLLDRRGRVVRGHGRRLRQGRARPPSVTALARYTIRAAVMRNRSPAGILRWLNAAMLRQRAGRFVTIAIARLELEPDGTRDRHRRQRRPSAAADPARRPGSSRSSARPARCSACCEDVELADRSARLAAGDALVLYTDGLTEVARAARVDAARSSTPPSPARAAAARRASSTTSTRGRGGGRRPAARRPRAARAARSALAVGVDVDVVDLPLAARRARKRKRTSLESRLPTHRQRSASAPTPRRRGRRRRAARAAARAASERRP